jgi:uncharacterized membrane protein YgcG
MTRRPFDPRNDGGLGEADPVVRELETYAGLTAAEQPHGLADRVMAAVADEPTPRRGILAGLLASLESGPGGGMTRMVLVGATMALAVLAVVAFGQLANLFPDPQIGPSPLPSVPESVLPSTTETPTPSPSPSERPSRTPRPSPTDDESPEPSGSPDDDGSESPEPSDDDNSGPGGGDDDGGNSGPGGGDDGGGNSGPGGGGSD